MGERIHQLETVKWITIERMAYVSVVIGLFLDQLSTRLVIAHPYIYEGNKYVVMMMERGVWLLTDVVVVLGCIQIPYLFIRQMRDRLPYGRYIALVIPMTVGLVRSMAATWNVCLLLSVVIT